MEIDNVVRGLLVQKAELLALEASVKVEFGPSTELDVVRMHLEAVQSEIVQAQARNERRLQRVAVARPLRILRVG